MSVQKLQAPNSLVFNEQELKSFCKPRSIAQRVCDFVLSLLRQFSLYFFQMFPWFMCRTSPYETPKWDAKSRGLIVMLHGLNGHPYFWHQHLQKAHQQIEGASLYTPQIKKGGNVAAEVAIEPIITRIRQYTHLHPGKPVCLLGFSNGARLALKIEWHLRHMIPFTPVMLSNVAGPHFGSSLVDIGNLTGMSYLLMTAPVNKELAYGSANTRETLLDVQQPLRWNTGKRQFTFYASCNDRVVPDIESALPKIGHPAKYVIKNGHSHFSLLFSVVDAQIKECKQWLDDNQPRWARRWIASLT